MLSEGNQSVLVSEVSEGDQSMLISEGDQSMLISEGDQSMLISEGDQSISDLISEISLNEDIFENILEPEAIGLNEDIFENILEPEAIAESEANVYYPNEAYADLMTLLTKYIEIGRKYMDNINLPNLTFDKTHVITYKNNEYYLHHRSLIKCIKSILSIPDLSQHFTLSFENFEVDGKRAYSEQNTE